MAENAVAVELMVELPMYPPPPHQALIYPAKLLSKLRREHAECTKQTTTKTLLENVAPGEFTKAAAGSDVDEPMRGVSVGEEVGDGGGVL